jgi:hypothetical protein
MQAIVPRVVSSSSSSGNEQNGCGSNKNTANVFDQAANTSRLIEHLHNGTWKHQKLLAVQTKPPKFHEGKIIGCNGDVFCSILHSRILASCLQTRPISSKLQWPGSNPICQKHAVGK